MMRLFYGKNGVEPKIGDYPALGMGWNEFIRDLEEFKPDVLIVSTTTGTIQGDFQAMQLAKEKLPEITTIGRGEYLTVNVERVLPEHQELDYILVGEPEGTLIDLAEGKEVSETAGLAWLENGEIQQTEKREQIEDLDSLPFPARDLLANDRYRSPDSHNPITVIYANRGCPFHCIYCPAGVVSEFRVRLRKPEHIVEEIRECVEKYNVREFLFHGDTFTINKKWVFELCDRLIEADLGIRWGCNSRVDTIDQARAEKMKAAGCWVVAFGFETGNQEILDKMKKSAKVDKAYSAVQVCKEAGLCTHGFFVVGVPWDTEETMNETYEFAKKLDTDFFDFNIASPLPGTELFDIVKEEGLMQQELDTETGYHKAAVRTYTLSPEFLNDWRKKHLLKMSLRPKYVARTLLRAQRNGQAMNYLQAGFKRLGNLLSN